MSNFSWKEIYIEIAKKIKDKTTDDLIDLLKDCEGCQINYLKNKKSGKDEWIKLDLFTFFGSFNRAGFESRKKILQHIIAKLDLDEKKIPSDFNGIPVMENRNSFFYWADNEEKSNDLKTLNTLFKIAIENNQNEIEEAFNECLNIQGIGLSKLTTGLFWINPEQFMPIAGPVISYLKRKFPNFEYSEEKGAKAWDKIFKGMKWEQYNIVLGYLKDEGKNKKSFKELSLESIESSVENEILENKNVIFHGAPGTGKTYSVLKAVESLTDGDTSRYILVQFHPSYGYEDFIDGIKPVKGANSGNINLELENGTFKTICIRAFKNLQSKEVKPYFFIADEINRAELSRVFGELLLCLEEDKRLRFEGGKLVGAKIKTQNSNLWEEGKHEVVIDEKDNRKELFFGIPENLYFIGTMNDIDRSVDSFDMALRRRFTWIRTRFNERAIREKYTNHKKLEEYIKACYRLNEYITLDKDGYGLGFDYQLGQSYFLKPKDLTDDELELTWDKYIAPLLTEYLRSVVEQHEIPKKLEEAQKRFKL